MDHEMDQIVKNNTWDFVLPLEACKLVGLKWVLKVKRDSNGQIIRHKVQLVVKHYAQTYGINF